MSYRLQILHVSSEVQKYSQLSHFFELQTTEFACTFMWTVQPNDKRQKYKTTKVQKNKTELFKKNKMQKDAKNVKM